MEALIVCSVGRVRALEAKLPGPEKLARWAQAGRLGDFVAELPAAGFPVPDPGSDPDLSRWLTAENAAAGALCARLLGGSGAERLCRLPADRGNIFLLGRREKGLLPGNGLFNPLGMLGRAELEAAWNGRGLFRLPPALRPVFTRGRAVLEEEGLPAFEHLVNVAVFTLMSEAAASSAILARLAAFSVDRANIRSFLSGSAFFLEGGLAAPEAYRGGPGAGRAPRVPPEPVRFHYPALAEAEGSLRIEAAFHRIEEDILSGSRFIALGPEPVVAYFHRRARESAELRRIMFAAAYGRPAGEGA